LHFHPHEYFVTVLKGTWWVSGGTKFHTNATALCRLVVVTHYGQAPKTSTRRWVIIGESLATAN